MRNSIPANCAHPGPAMVHDANGWKTWCITCGAPLNHDLEVRRFNALLFIPFLIAVAWLVAFFMVVNAGAHPDGQQILPSPHANPAVVRSTP